MSKPRRIFLVRHGQSMGNVDRSVYATVPDWKVELTEVGWQQARDAGDQLATKLIGEHVGVYTSPYRRTTQTWEGINERLTIHGIGVKWVKEDPRLREQEWGNLRSWEDSKTRDIERERDTYGTFFYRFTNGESGADVWSRCSDLLDTLYRDFQKDTMPDNVIMVTHGYAVRVLLMRWLHWTVDTFHTLANPRNAECFELRLDPVTEHYVLMTPFLRVSEAPKVP
jgi:broad specificity phosphatase PhoE